jgi:hypothetical protein
MRTRSGGLEDHAHGEGFLHGVAEMRLDVADLPDVFGRAVGEFALGEVLAGDLRDEVVVESVQLTVEDYHRWLDQVRAEDTPERRYRFASAPPEFQ